MVIKPVKGDSFLSLVVPMRLSNENWENKNWYWIYQASGFD
jgi:hypothetical protein